MGMGAIDSHLRQVDLDAIHRHMSTMVCNQYPYFRDIDGMRHRVNAEPSKDYPCPYHPLPKPWPP